MTNLGRADSLAVSPAPLLDRLREHAARRPDVVAYQEIGLDAAHGRRITYGELTKRADAMSAHLRSNIAEGGVVLICCRNSIDFPIAFLATLTAGCTAFPVSADCTQDDFKSAAQATDAVAMIKGSELIDLKSATSRRRDADFAADLLLQSSGTTGRPKIVRRSGISLSAVADQIVRSMGFRSDDRVLSTLPLCHSYGLEHGLLAPLAAGSTIHLMSGFDLATVLQQLSDGGITIFPGVPSFLEMLAQLSEQSRRLAHFRAVYSAGASLPRSVFDAFSDTFGVRVGQLYGATEVGSVTYNNPGDDDFNPASVGTAMNDVRVRICRTDDPAAAVPVGTEGQVCIRAASMMSGYVGDAESPFVEEFFSTADLGRLDDCGRLTITGRLKLLIDVGGLKVNPIEVEELLLEHPEVAGCVVVPIRQSETVFRLKAVIVPRDPARPPRVEDLRAMARERLTRYKVPRLFELRSTLPRSATGKILRHLVEA